MDKLINYLYDQWGLITLAKEENRLKEALKPILGTLYLIVSDTYSGYYEMYIDGDQAKERLKVLNEEKVKYRLETIVAGNQRWETDLPF